MGDAVLFELLHLEIVAQVYKQPEAGDTEHGKCISTLEGMGFRAGQGLIERLVLPASLSSSSYAISKPTLYIPWGIPLDYRQQALRMFTKETPSFKDELDVMKFICKEFWTNLFWKQIDNLRTNHQGTYVLQDNRFRLLTPISSGKQYLEEAPKFLAFTCGMVRGALSNLGIDSTVTAEVSLMPACKFHIVMQKP